LAEFYLPSNKEQSLSEKQITPYPGGGNKLEAVETDLFLKGFEDDITPLDQYNLNTLIRAIKENLSKIQSNKSSSDSEIKSIKDYYLTEDKLKEFLKKDGTLAINKILNFNFPVKFDDVAKFDSGAIFNDYVTFQNRLNLKQGYLTTPIDLNISSSSTRLIDVAYLHNVLDNLLLVIDGGTVEDLGTI
jgi:hypothetical protein